MEKKKVLIIGNQLMFLAAANELKTVVDETVESFEGLKITLNNLRDNHDPFFMDNKPKYPTKKNWKRKLKKNRR